MTIRVVLVDDHRMFREALRTPLDAEADIDIVGEAATGAAALSALEQLNPDVMVVDIGLPDMSGIELTRTITRLRPGVHVVALSGHADRLYIEEMLKAGAYGYVVKSAGADELIAAIRAVVDGRKFLSSEVTGLMIRHFHEDGPAESPPSTVLGRREIEVLRLLAEGKRSGEIAASLGITVGTTEVHRRNIKQKLGIHSTAELTRYAIREGLITS
ncbi:MAG TPA: response regulator transcription factor [Rhodospirillaceae bacterium]|nr:response regulator transcription factor [Rhodospirillaceae bacterium]